MSLIEPIQFRFELSSYSKHLHSIRASAEREENLPSRNQKNSPESWEVFRLVFDQNIPPPRSARIAAFCSNSSVRSHFATTSHWPPAPSGAAPLKLAQEIKTNFNTLSRNDFINNSIYLALQNLCLLILETAEKVSVPSVDIRGYAKYVLREGSNEEKREILGCLKSRIYLAEKKITIKA